VASDTEVPWLDQKLADPSFRAGFLIEEWWEYYRGKANERETLARLVEQHIREAYAAAEVELREENARLCEALAEWRATGDFALLAMNDWLHQYAPEHCNPDDVARTRSRIEYRGGTIAYITGVLESLRAALAATRDEAESDDGD